jgi:hypothetical protein
MNQISHSYSEYFTTVEAADYLRCSPQYLDIGRCKGYGPPFCKLGRAVRYRKAALDEWMQRGERRFSRDGKEAAHV